MVNNTCNTVRKNVNNWMGPTKGITIIETNINLIITSTEKFRQTFQYHVSGLRLFTPNSPKLGLTQEFVMLLCACVWLYVCMFVCLFVCLFVCYNLFVCVTGNLGDWVLGRGGSLLLLEKLWDFLLQ